ncbi:WD40 repeat-like protein [Rhizoctonia solani]|uniref:WD40 repeat-like protein n=1 Tax=Rhizoctonia solani TaxID=456999 RepID=A0A8H7I2I9_9AGAM|nr:WD40 repeat-like protein [Rhizoctonia solani]
MPLIMTLQEALERAKHKVKKRLGIESTTVGHPDSIPCPLPSSANPAKFQTTRTHHENQGSHRSITEPEPSHPSRSPPKTTTSTLTAIGLLLAVLESSTHALGSLKSAIGQLKLCVDTYRSSCKDRKEHDELADKLDGIIGDLIIHAKLPMDPVATDSVKRIQSDLMEEAKKVTEMQARSSGRRLIDALDGYDGIVECYRRIDGHLQRLTRNVGLSTLQGIGEQITESRLARMCPTSSAVYRSAESSNVYRRPCTPGTRQAQIKLLLEWASAPDAGRTCWMNGMAGTGKTTIAYSVCAELEKASRLGASFFCSRTMLECSQVKNIIPSIAYQLARFSLPFRNVLVEILGQKPDAHTQGLAEQYEQLIIEPLKKVKDSLPDDFIVVIDALDECDNESSVGQILDLLMTTPCTLPIRFLMSSRPENEITRKITGRPDGQDDAQLKQWSSVLERCGTLFIYASTACLFIKQEHAMDCLDEAVNTIANSALIPMKHHNLIDNLYLTIFRTAFARPKMGDENVERMRSILDTVVCAVEPMNLDAIADLLGLKSVKLVYRLLQPLRSVLNVPRDTGVVTTLHASFPDFMLSRTRSSEFCCSQSARHATLAEACLGLIDKAEPKMNICGLPSSHLLDEEVEDLGARVAWAISPGLAYASRYWSTHLDRSVYKPILLDAVRNFFFARLLLWMEVANLTSSMRYGVGTGTVDYAERWCVHPHIYVSMLPFWPRSRPISLAYMPRTSDLVQPTGTAISRRQLALMATWKISTSVVGSISLSGDGSRLVVPTNTGIDILDTTTGESVHSLTDERAQNVWLVAMSPDGNQVAFTEDKADETIRVWNIQTGEQVGQPFEGHTDWVRAVSFTTDGSRLASGSDDKTVRLWDIKTGKTASEPLTGHSDDVCSVAFSPNGKLIASASQDNTIRIYSAETGRVALGPLEGHTDKVNWMSTPILPPRQLPPPPPPRLPTAFDTPTAGSEFVSGSEDGTVHVWDTETVNWRSSPCAPQKGSDDGTVRMWGVSTGQQIARLLEARSPILSVGVSPDGQHVVCGSKIARYKWKQLVVCGEHDRAHDNLVLSVSISPDGLYVASGSNDGTVRVWDGQTGKLILGPLRGHTDWVGCVQFSPDGSHVASCSDDGTIRFWDVSGCRAESPEDRSTSVGMGLFWFGSHWTVADGAVADTEVAISDGSGGKGSGRWSVDEDGWVVESPRRRVAWVPSELRACLLSPPEDFRIAAAGYLKLEWLGAKVGETWAGCYVP